jgi:hypothetical protein
MKDRYSRILDGISELMSETGAKYAIIGGVAVSIHGIPRLTMDVDVSILLEKEGISGFLGKARKAGFVPIVRNARAFAEKTGVVPMKFRGGMPFERCDFIIAQNALEKAAIERARPMKVGPCKVMIVSAEDLFLHKLLSDRPRDREDAEGIAMRRRNLDRRYIMSWVKKIANVAGGAALARSAEKLLMKKAG